VVLRTKSEKTETALGNTAVHGPTTNITLPETPLVPPPTPRPRKPRKGRTAVWQRTPPVIGRAGALLVRARGGVPVRQPPHEASSLTRERAPRAAHEALRSA
jgi:hypothetical protein